MSETKVDTGSVGAEITSVETETEKDTLPGALRLACAEGAGRSFLLTEERDWTYADVHDAGARLAAAFTAVGVRAGERIAIAAPNCVEWVVTWFAAARLGSPLVTLNVAYREHEFDYMLNQSGAVALVCVARHGDFDFVEFLDAMRPRLPKVREYVFLDGPGFDDTGFDGSRTWDELMAAVPDGDCGAEPSVRAGDPAVILYTSGTTGHPKGAVLTHGSILASARAQAEHLGQRSDDVAIGHMPLNHVGGMTCTVVAAMVTGGAVALLPGFRPELALRTVAERRVSIFVGVPTMYARTLGLPDFARVDTASVRICIVGGSNVEPAMGRRILEEFPGARLANLYGLSESSGGCVISAADDDLDTLVETIGVPIGAFDVRVVDPDGAPVAAGAEGELQVHGACVADGYWENDEESRGTFVADGWLATGDMASLRPDGRIALRGRTKEMYVRGGYNVYPAEIENVIAGDPTVAMSAVIGIPHEVLGEIGRAYVVPADGAHVDVDAVTERCRRQLARYKIPDEIEIVDSLPLTPSGKIKKVALRSSMPGG